MSYNLTLLEVLEQSHNHHRDKEAIYDGVHRITFDRLYNEVRRLSSALMAKGISKGDRVIVCLPNWYEFIAIYFSLGAIGAILVPSNTRYRTEELEYILKNSGAKAVFLTEQFGHFDVYKRLLKNEQHKRTLEHIFTVRFQREGHASYEDLLAQGEDLTFLKATIDPEEDIFSILYTSGTTGLPKGAMLTHKNIVHTGTLSAEVMECSSDDVFLVAVPVFHVFGMVPGILSAMAVGAKIVLMEKFNAEGALHLIENERITVHHGVPTMFILELNHPNFKTTDLSSLRTGIIAAAPCPVEIVRKIRTEMGCEVVVSYGLTESSAGVTMTSFDDDDLVRSETVGKVLPGASAKIVDTNREEVPLNTVGELVIKGFGIMKGYYKMPEQTQEALDDDGWFFTGDLATIDEQGYIRIVGRKKEMIIRGGYNIYPVEVEEIFYKHPSVLQVAVIGLPDSVLGEITCAAIKLKPNQLEDEDELRTFLKNKIADYKIPDRIVFLDEFPMTASGKIMKIRLQEQLREQIKLL